MKKISLFLTVLSVLVLASCQRQHPNMIIIGLDGWSSFSVDSVSMPTVRAMMENGVYNLRKRSIFPSSSSANWAAMFMGVPPETSGFTRWNTETPDVPSRIVNEHNIFPTFFSILREQRPDFKIACMYEWEGVKYDLDTLAFDFQKHIVQDTMRQLATTELVCDYLIANKPDVFYIHYDEPDHSGHKLGWESKGYFAACERLDTCIANIVAATKEAGTYDNTVFVVISDHGGKGHKHGKATLQEMEAPIILFGKGIPAKGASDAWMVQYDVAPTLAAIYGLKTPPEWLGRPWKY